MDGKLHLKRLRITKNMKTIEEFSVKIDGDINKAKALVGICYSLGLIRTDCIDGDESTLEDSLEFVKDADEFKYFIIGGDYGIDMSQRAYRTNFNTIDEALEHLVEELKTTVVRLNDNYDAIIKGDGIEVGCQFITYDKLEEVMRAAGYKFE